MRLARSTHLIQVLGLMATVLSICSSFCRSIDTIASSQSIRDNETIISNGQKFKLGFFSPPNTTRRYVGIMYNIPVTKVVWVANRDKPLIDSSGILTMSQDGNLVVLNGQKEILWSSNVSSVAAYSYARVLDTGRLVLVESSDGRVLWDSFKHPSDSFIQTMTITTDEKRKEKIWLTSWKSPSDPSIGTYSHGIDPGEIPQLFIWNGSNPCWRSGPWNGTLFLGIPGMDSVHKNGPILNDDKQGAVSFSYTYDDQSVAIHIGLNSQGVVEHSYNTFGSLADWKVIWSTNETECDVYGKCGPFGSCNSKDSTICSCLTGFEPKNEEEWSRGYWASGCIRKTQLKCERNSRDGGRRVKDDTFLKFNKVKVPDFARRAAGSQEDCRTGCLGNCSCVAYAFHPGIGCMQWNGSLIDLQQFSSDAVDIDLFIRVANTEVDKEKNATVVLAVATSLGSSVAVAICIYFSRRWMVKKHEIKKKREEQILFSNSVAEAASENSAEVMPLDDKVNQIKLKDLPLFSVKVISNATEDFSAENKLGRGGFGSVYKGTLPDGQEIAVKRLSSSSHQGIQEFMNEVVVISKLQHRNLVKLLGCCIEAEEKMLIYEYLPNRSLDAYLFDSYKQERLDWKRREIIIEGIGRGLLYLHRDSRLKIIHRDLKASNILLDEHLNPKISDFGIAKIFGGNQDEANTRRVVGTYGYMAPEYAMDGIFSEKSDVYSFGVLVLEIVSGRRNTGFYNDEDALSLIGFAWKLWNEGDNVMKLASPAVFDPGFQMDILLRWIHVGLLCVQDSPKDRPTISSVLSMLSAEIANLPAPKQPAFTERQTPSDMSCQQTINYATVTVIGGR